MTPRTKKNLLESPEPVEKKQVNRIFLSDLRYFEICMYTVKNN